jgi:hypothetical protein
MEHRLAGLKDVVKRRLRTNVQVHQNNASYWQLVFLQSKANGCAYGEKDLPHHNWQWPENTWFQNRLNQHVEDNGVAVSKKN